MEGARGVRVGADEALSDERAGRVWLERGRDAAAAQRTGARLAQRLVGLEAPATLVQRACAVTARHEAYAPRCFAMASRLLECVVLPASAVAQTPPATRRGLARWNFIHGRLDAGASARLARVCWAKASDRQARVLLAQRARDEAERAGLADAIEGWLLGAGDVAVIVALAQARSQARATRALGWEDRGLRCGEGWSRFGLEEASDARAAYDAQRVMLGVR